MRVGRVVVVEGPRRTGKYWKVLVQCDCGAPSSWMRGDHVVLLQPEGDGLRPLRRPRILVADAAWRVAFAAFLQDMGPKPGPADSLDRIDNDGPYGPQNCRRSTRAQQRTNQRRPRRRRPRANARRLFM
jgi:hypothetical protein